MATDFDFYEDLLSELSSGLETYWGNVSADIVAAITPSVITGLMIYMALWGWSMMRGLISEPVVDGMARMLRLTLVTTVAINIGYYNGFLAEMLWQSPDALANIVASGYADGTSNMQFLDSLMGRFYDMGTAYNDKAHADAGVTGIPDLSLWFTGLAVWIVGGAVTLYAAFLLTLCKMGLALLLGVGPIFVAFLLFEPTKKFFDAWIGQALNFVFLVMLTAAVVKLFVAIIETYLSAPGVVAAMADPSINQALPPIVFSIIGVLLMTWLPSVASALGGGVAVSTLGAAGYAWSKLTGTSRSTLSSMRPTNMRRSLNRARADYRIAKGAVGATVGAPGAIYRKITGGNRNRIARAS